MERSIGERSVQFPSVKDKLNLGGHSNWYARGGRPPIITRQWMVTHHSVRPNPFAAAAASTSLVSRIQEAQKSATPDSGKGAGAGTSQLPTPPQTPPTTPGLRPR